MFCWSGCGRHRRPSVRLRQSQVDAAIRFCAKLFGAEYADTLARAADVAVKGEQRAAKA